MYDVVALSVLTINLLKLHFIKYVTGFIFKATLTYVGMPLYYA